MHAYGLIWRTLEISGVLKAVYGDVLRADMVGILAGVIAWFRYSHCQLRQYTVYGGGVVSNFTLISLITI